MNRSIALAISRETRATFIELFKRYFLSMFIFYPTGFTKDNRHLFLFSHFDKLPKHSDAVQQVPNIIEIFLRNFESEHRPVFGGHMSQVGKVDVSNFEAEVLNAEKPVLVDFWAEWCGPCRQLGPVLDEVATEVGEKASVVKVNVDENSELAQKYGIRGIPTMIFFKNGEAAKTLVGLQSKDEIKKSLEELA